MLIDDLFSSFNQSYDEGDIKNATMSLMRALGNILITDKNNFVNLLNESEIPATADMGEISLIDLFVENVGKNPQLALGASLLINMKNRNYGFDGELEDVNDENVKRAYRAICDYFRNTSYDDKEQFSSVFGGAIAGLSGLGTKILEGKQKKEAGFTEDLIKQKQAKQEMLNQAIALRRQEQETKLKEQEAKLEKSKRNKTIIIIASVVGGLVLIGGIIYLIRRK